MKAAAFEYHAPSSVSAATDLLARYADEDARILAGGQSLVPAMALRVAAPAHLIDINGIDELAGLTFDEDGHLEVDACVRHATFQRPVEPGPLGEFAEQGGPLHRALPDPYTGHDVRQPGERRSRVGVVSGCGDARTRSSPRSAAAVPRSDPGVRLVPGPDDHRPSTRRAPAAGAVPGTSIRSAVFGFQEFSRRAGDFALAMALVTFRMQSGFDRRSHASASVRSKPSPRRITQAEEIFRGEQPSRELYEAGGQGRSRGRGSAYRRALRRGLSSRSDAHDGYCAR